MFNITGEKKKKLLFSTWQLIFALLLFISSISKKLKYVSVPPFSREINLAKANKTCCSQIPADKTLILGLSRNNLRAQIGRLRVYG